MKLKNNFVDYAWTTFMDGWKCWYCEMNTADSLHHIMGRGGPGSTVESSVLNAAPMCNQKCHLAHHGKITTHDYQKIFLQKTFDYLSNRGYEFTDLDKEFIKKYESFYRRDQIRLAGKNINKQDILRDTLVKEKPDKRHVSSIHDPVQKQTKIRRKGFSSNN